MYIIHVISSSRYISVRRFLLLFSIRSFVVDIIFWRANGALIMLRCPRCGGGFSSYYNNPIWPTAIVQAKFIVGEYDSTYCFTIIACTAFLTFPFGNRFVPNPRQINLFYKLMFLQVMRNSIHKNCTKFSNFFYRQQINFLVKIWLWLWEKNKLK